MNSLLLSALTVLLTMLCLLYTSLRIVFEFGLLDFLTAYAIREMHNYTVLILDA